MTKYSHGPPGGRAPCFKNARGDLPGWIDNFGRAPCAAPVSRNELWLTYQNWVCQDFLFLNVPF